MSLDFLGYIGGMYATLDGALFSFGEYFSRTLFFSAFCASLFVYKKKGHCHENLS
jgi:hypothetical protein